MWVGHARRHTVICDTLCDACVCIHNVPEYAIRATMLC